MKGRKSDVSNPASATTSQSLSAATKRARLAAKSSKGVQGNAIKAAAKAAAAAAVDVDSGAAAPAPAARAPTSAEGAAAKAAALAGIAARAGAAREAREARAASGRAALRPAVPQPTPALPA